jgi:DNA repair protein RecO (recombination protein O)
MARNRIGEAIILRARVYGESDKIVTFLTKDAGKLTGIAKGAKNSRRRFANCLDPFTRVRVYFRSRPGASLVFMESCDLLTAPDGLVEPAKFAYGSYLVELVDLLTGEAHPVPEVYALLEEGLQSLADGAASAAFLRAFELQLLKRAGYDPRLHECCRCLGRFAAEDPAFLDATHSTVVCAACKHPDPALVPMSGATLNLLTHLKDGCLRAAQPCELRGTAAAEASGLVGRLLAVHLPRPPRSTKLIASLSP